MPELPEVHTTVEGLKKVIKNKTITEIWSDFHVNTAHGHRNNLKNKNHLKEFKKNALGAKIKNVERRGKNILIRLGNGHTIIVHMKMTGHLMVENFEKEKKFIHFICTFSDGKKLVLSDMRKFASVCITEDKNLDSHEGLVLLGPDPLKDLGLKEFTERIKNKKSAPIKKVLLDQSVIAGIGNIYSDEILWATAVHPLSHANKIPEIILRKMFENTKEILNKSIKLGGDSVSDYLNAFGQKGGFQKCHKAYRQTGKSCPKRNCEGIIKKTVIGGRSAHFCPKHQIFYK